MSDAPALCCLHASCVRWLGRGLLLRGPPGRGKSDLLIRLIEAGADLLADDLVELEVRNGRLAARPKAEAGLVELRGQGLFRLPALASQPVHLLVDCHEHIDERLPEPVLEGLLGVALPRIALACRDASAVARLRTVMFAAPIATGSA